VRFALLRVIASYLLMFASSGDSRLLVLDDANRKEIIKLSGCFAVVVLALVRPATCAFRRPESGIPPQE
jgi:hypothetical protein